MLILAMLTELDAEEQDLVLEIWERYGETMYAVALDVLGNREDAEDAVEETVLHIMSHLDKFMGRDGDSVKNQIVIYIRAVARNAAIDAYRKKKRRGGREIPMPEDAPEPEDDAPIPEEIVLTRELQKTVQDALNLLPRITKDAVTLFYLEDYSYEEIADTLAIPVSQVKGRLFRARKKLREILGGV
ncbi:MAG: RNA polymerase sigma factor [Clostridia bacterium]|nr:RNA polymerase sigma factor [Clostridia bacterium]